MNLSYEKDYKLAGLLGYDTLIIGQRVHIAIKHKWIGFPTTNDLGKIRLLRIMKERKDWDKFLTWLTAFELIDLLLDKTGRFREAVIEFLEEQGK